MDPGIVALIDTVICSHCVVAREGANVNTPTRDVYP